MAEYKIGNCTHCGSDTHIGRYEGIDRVMEDVIIGRARCCKCTRDRNYHSNFDIFQRDNGNWKLIQSRRKT